MLSRKKLKKVGLLIDQYTLENQHGTIWNPEMLHWKMIFLLTWVTFRFHADFQGELPLGFHVHFGNGLCRIIHLLYNAVRIRIAISSIAVSLNLHLKWSPGLVFKRKNWLETSTYIHLDLYVHTNWLGTWCHESLKYGDGDFNNPLLPITYLAWGFQVPTGCRCLYVTLETRCVRIIWTIPAFHWSWTNGTLGAA